MTSLKIISLNIAVFLVLSVAGIISTGDFSSEAADLMALPAGFPAALTHPWALLTYMFLHLHFWHLLVNMLWLGWFGTLLERFTSGRCLATVYLLGGVVAAGAYLAVGAPEGSALVGASGAVLAVIGFTLIASANRRIRFAFLGAVSLKWLIAIGLGLFLCSSAVHQSAPMAAHLGGLIFGALAGWYWRLYSRRRMHRMEQFARNRIEKIELINKVKHQGYASLTRNEQLALFNLSQRSEAENA